MAALSEKILWPIVGVFIFGVLAGFYIDDRRRLLEEGSTGSTDQQVSNTQQSSTPPTKNNSATSSGTTNNNTKQTASSTSSSPASSGSSSQATGATSMSIDEYLAQSTNERSSQLEANVAHHQGFSGSIDEYLSGSKPKATNKMQAKADSSSTKNTQQAAGASSMSMDEYQAKASNQSSGQISNGSAYHGNIDGYLAKFGNGAQTPMKKQSTDPFNEKEHMGFHGSYEEYAKKYN